MLKKLISYFTPVVYRKIPSKINNQLQLVYHKGKLTLDTKNTNYSYGELQNTLQQALSYIGFSKIRKANSVLILGLGAGGIVSTLRNQVKYTNEIDSVELDEQIVSLGKKYFDLDLYNHKHTIHILDAFEYVLRTKKTYGLIIIDIFIDYHMPDFLFQNYFVEHLLQLLDKEGFILFNTIVINKEHAKRNKDFTTLFDPEKYSLRTYPRSLGANEIFTIKKLH